MLNGLEKTLERKLPEGERRWVIRDRPQGYSVNSELLDSVGPSRLTPETRNLKPTDRNLKPYALSVHRLHHDDDVSVRRCSGRLRPRIIKEEPSSCYWTKVQYTTVPSTYSVSHYKRSG